MIFSPPPLALYIHWPFCLAKCPYCDFNSHVRETIPQERFAQALLRELTYEAERLNASLPTTIPKRRLASIFFGGGTPSLMTAENVARLVETACTLFTPVDDLEITLEANPTSAEIGKFRAFRQAGINRLSLGIQSLENDALAMLGREHSSEQAIAALEMGRNVFKRLSFDLIYARPGQTKEAWQRELRQALALAADHLSLYQLTIEPGTRFEALSRRGLLELPDDRTAAQLYNTTEKEAGDYGLKAYEVSNYAQHGAESRHNLAYWRYDDYLGIGPGAHSRLTFPTLSTASSDDHSLYAQRRHYAPEPWAERVERTGTGVKEEQCLTPEERGREALLMGLRLTEGVEANHFLRRTSRPLKDCLDADILRACIEEDYLTYDGQKLKTTSQGRLLLESILARLVL